MKELVQGAVVETQENTINNVMSVYFDVIEEHTINLQSQITDNWMEDNSVINDHIANEPIIVNLRGLSGELVYEPSETKADGAINTLQATANNKLGNSTMNKLSAIGMLYPPVDNYTQLAKNVIVSAEASYNRYKKIVNKFLSNGYKQARLRKIYQDLIVLREAKTALVIQTPYNTFDNMYIQSLTLRQNNLNYITDIELSLKQLNFVNSLTTTADEQTRDKVNFLQRDEVENHSITQGEPIHAGGGEEFEGDGKYLFKLSAEYNG